MVQKMLGLCEAENGTPIDELLQAGASGHKRAWKHVEANSGSRGRQCFCQRRQKVGKLKGKERRITRKEYQRLVNKFDMEGFMAHKDSGISQETKLCKTEVLCPGKKATP